MTREPPSAKTLMLFVTWLIRREGTNIGPARTALTAVRASCSALGHDLSAFEDEQLRLLMRGFRKSAPQRSKPKRLPITIWLLSRLLPLCPSTRLAHTTFAAMIVGQHLLLRSSEFVAKKRSAPSLLRRHLTIHPDRTRAELFIANSKTDTFHQGATLQFSANYGRLCPVSWLEEILASAPSQSPDSPLFQRDDGSPLSYTDLQRFIKALCSRAGIDTGSVSTHSLRIGGATSLIKLGFSPECVQNLGRWLSDAYKGYVRYDSDLAARVSAALASAAEDRLMPIFGSLPLESALALNSDNFADLRL